MRNEFYVRGCKLLVAGCNCFLSSVDLPGQMGATFKPCIISL